MNQEPEIPQTQRRIDMTAIKKETVLNFFHNAYNEYDIDSRENSITESYDFIINTGIARIFIKIGRKRWDKSDNSSIVEFLKSKEQQICEALFINQNAILPIK
jgi:hypothetical protein